MPAYHDPAQTHALCGRSLANIRLRGACFQCTCPFVHHTDPLIHSAPTSGFPVTPVTLNPAGFFRRIPLAPHQMRDRLTRTEDAIVLCHLGVPRIDREQWSLTIDGLVERPLTLRFNDLERYPKALVTSFHQCAGNPWRPFERTRGACNT